MYELISQEVGRISEQQLQRFSEDENLQEYIIEAEIGNDFQTYGYDDGTMVNTGTPVGVELPSVSGKYVFYLLDGIYYR